MVFSNHLMPEGEDSIQDRMADTPRSVGAPMERYSKIQGMRESTKYGILLFLLQSGHELSDGQRLWIVYRSRKFSEAELLRSAELSLRLLQDDILRTRMRWEIRKIHHSVPSLNPKNLPEKRRIGIGYRDKGALRPLHRNRVLGERAFWDEDIQYLLPLTHEVTGRWITADEVVSLVGIDRLNLALTTIQSMYSNQLATLFSKLTWTGRSN